MKIWRADSETVVLSDFNPLVRDLLHRLVASADPAGNASVRDRLYSSPTGGREPEFDNEWHELVGGDLHEQFTSALGVVQSDLARLPLEDEVDDRLDIPMEHVESWVNALNQARLAIAARHNFTESDMESVPSEGNPQAFPLFQMYFYGVLQERFIYELTS